MFKNLLFTTVVVFTLSACGGGGSSTNTPSNNPTIPSPPSTNNFAPLAEENGLAIYGDAEYVANSNGGLALVPVSGAKLKDVTWRQTSGPSVDLISPHTPTTGFIIPQAGSYSFTVSAKVCSTDKDNSCSTAPVVSNVSFSASNSTQLANIRMAHSAVEQGRVSFRIDASSGLSVNSAQWSVAGKSDINAPDITFEVQDNRVFFAAPEVSRDTVFKLNADIELSNGTTTNESVLLGVRNADIDEENGYFPRYSDNIVTENMFPYNADSPYADDLQVCIYSNILNDSCRFSRLPLIGMENMDPSVDDILDRTLVSHPWMGERFKQYLESSAVGPDMLRLLRGVTGIVISYEVRPSFYWSATGAIYLDADNFWLTPLERDTLNEAPDYRAGFGSDLQFIVPWRYVKNNDYYPAGSYAIADRRTRSFADLEADISWLMYHELGHANDFFPPSTWSSLSTSLSPLAAINRSSQNPDSDLLAQQLPLRSDELKAFARVNFGGDDATQAQQDTTAQTIANLFSSDVATSFYAFYTTREDYALLFEKFMMKYRLDADSDIAVLASRDVDPSLRVVWGQRNRFNDTALQDRVLFAVERILPELNGAAIQQNLPSPIFMDTTADWFDNINISGTNKAAKRVNMSSVQRDQRLRKDLLQKHQH